MINVLIAGVDVARNVISLRAAFDTDDVTLAPLQLITIPDVPFATLAALRAYLEPRIRAEVVRHAGETQQAPDVATKLAPLFSNVFQIAPTPPTPPPQPPVDQSDLDNVQKTIKALALCVAQVGGLTNAQMKALFKTKYDSLP